MQNLMKKAETAIKPENFVVLNAITRDKDPKYFQDIFENEKGVMKKCLKDGFGNPECPINGCLKGVFFSAKVNWATGNPFPHSPHGTRRLKLAANELITADKKLYFAAFYCTIFNEAGKGEAAKGRQHTLTLVLCEPGSNSDKFCEKALPGLDITENDFMKIDTKGKVKVTKGATVEIFYTEDMNIPAYNFQLEDVKTTKNMACFNCNLK